MRDILMIVQWIIIAGLFVECAVIFRNMKGRLHFYLFFSCIVTFVSAVGYLMVITSRTRDAYITSYITCYIGKVWICFALFLFITELVGVRVPRIVKAVLALISASTFIAVITNEYTGIYNKRVWFRVTNDLPEISRESGPWHYAWNAVIILYAVVAFVILIRAFCKEKNTRNRKRILMVILAMATESLAMVIEIFRLIPIYSGRYDMTMTGFLFGAIFIFIAIFKYNLLDTESLARDFVVDRLSEGIIAVDDLGDVKYYNKPAIDIFPELRSDSQGVVTGLIHAIDEDETIGIGGRLYSPEKNDLVQQGEKVGTIYVVKDETEHFQYMEQLKEQKTIADRANRAKSSFLASMSHEIRTPINAVLGMDEMILRESGEEQIRGYASDIRTAGRTLLSLINDILDLSKIEEGRMEILPTQYELASLISDLVNMIRERAKRKGLKLLINANKETPHVLYGDEVRIRQIILNLLTNAVKYTEEGEVELSIDYDKFSDSEIYICVTVRDTGIGMKEEDMEELFSPFKRIEETRNKNIEGTGLGMSIVRQLLALMDSQLDVKSVYGEGTTFSFVIRQQVVRWEPMGDYASRIADESSGESYHELFHAPDARILVVDDNEVNLSVVTSLLKRTKLQVDTAESGRDALALTKDIRYDIIFIDHMMPEMDGIETLHRLRQEESERGEDPVVCIALTANAISGAREIYIGEGFADFLSKPVDGRRLEEMIRGYLPQEKVQIPTYGDEVQENHETVSADSGYPEKADLPGFLRSVDGLDIREGLGNFAGSVDGYLSVLSVFRQTAAPKADEIEKLYREEAVEDYTIRVHALKSSARIIGALSLSDLARSLEDAGKEGDIDTIRRDTDRLLADYRALGEALAPLDEDEEELQELSEAGRADAFRTIGEIAGAMDYGLMEELLADLKKYHFSDEDRKTLGLVEEKLMQLDWNGIMETVKSGS